MIDKQITFLYTRDLPTSARFYEDILGLSLERDQGFCRIYRLTDSSLVGICGRDDAPQQSLDWAQRNVMLTLVVDDVDEWYETLKARGATFEKTPTLRAETNIYNCVLRDPNGYLIEIQKFLD